MLLRTSGTTGRPKGAELTHTNLAGNVEAAMALFGSSDGVIFGVCRCSARSARRVVTNTAVACGATQTLIPRFDPAKKALEVLQRDKVTVLQGVPTMYVALVQHPDNAEVRQVLAEVQRVRWSIVAGGGAQRGLSVHSFGVALLEGYGLSETSPVASFNHPDKEQKAGSIGTPIRDVEFRLIDSEWNDARKVSDREIAIKGPTMKVLAAARRDRGGHQGWLVPAPATLAPATRTAIFIVDRAKDMIIRGGYNVYPRVRSKRCCTNTRGAEARQWGVPDATSARKLVHRDALWPGATATPTRSASSCAIGSLRKYPRIVVHRGGTAEGSTGKILKREIRQPA